MSLIVHKYGGTSVGSVERIKAVAEKIVAKHRAGDKIVVAVSAMSGETNRLLGLACITGGGLLVGGNSLLYALDGGEVWKGDLLFMGAAFCWSTYSVLSRRFSLQAIPAIIAITCFAFFSFVPIYALLCASGVLQTHLLSAPTSEVLFQAVFQGGGSVVISGITFTQMIRYYGPVRSTMITSLVPGLSALGAVWWLGEPLDWHLMLGLLLVTCGILFGVQKTSKGS